MLGWSKPPGGGSGGGDVTGPAGAIDGDIVLFNGATGKIIKDSGVKLSSLTGGGSGVAFPIPLDIRYDTIRRDIFPPGGAGNNTNNSNSVVNTSSIVVGSPLPLLRESRQNSFIAPGQKGDKGDTGDTGATGWPGMDSRQGNNYTYQLMNPAKNDLRYANIFAMMGS